MSRAGLPALHLLLAFEAAARHLSFKTAADELAVTPSAISQRIRKLEDDLDVQLFDRLNRSIALTPSGERYLREIQHVLMELTDVTRRFRETEKNIFTVAMNIIIAQEMVIPRLDHFTDWVPNGQIAIRTRTTMKTFQTAGMDMRAVDAGIRIGVGPWPGFEHRVIGPLFTVPLCAPDLAPQIRDWDDILQQTLYCPRMRRAETQEAMRHPVNGRYPEKVVTFESLPESIRAVESGLGVMCGLMPVMTRLVLQGRLVAPVGSHHQSPESLNFMVPENHPKQVQLAKVYDWLVDCHQRLPMLPDNERPATQAIYTSA
mgnify:CR=1 FL=1